MVRLWRAGEGLVDGVVCGVGVCCSEGDCQIEDVSQASANLAGAGGDAAVVGGHYVYDISPGDVVDGSVSEGGVDVKVKAPLPVVGGRGFQIVTGVDVGLCGLFEGWNGGCGLRSGVAAGGDFGAVAMGFGGCVGKGHCRGGSDGEVSAFAVEGGSEDVRCGGGVSFQADSYMEARGGSGVMAFAFADVDTVGVSEIVMDVGVGDGHCGSPWAVVVGGKLAHAWPTLGPQRIPEWGLGANA